MFEYIKGKYIFILSIYDIVKFNLQNYNFTSDNIISCKYATLSFSKNNLLDTKQNSQENCQQIIKVRF